MKTLAMLIIWSFLVTASTNSWSQIRFDFVAGVSPGVNSNSPEKLINRKFVSDEFRLSLNRIEKQFFLGLNANLSMRAPFFAEAGITFSQRKSEYLMAYTYPNEVDPPQVLVPETENLLILPLSIGVSIGKVDIISGLNLTGVISKKTEMSHVNGYTTEESFLRTGWHTGVRHTFGRSMIGIQYQSSFNRLGAGTAVNGESLELNHVPGQFVMTAHFRFSKR